MSQKRDLLFEEQLSQLVVIVSMFTIALLNYKSLVKLNKSLAFR
jgi:hypothetical protein